LDNFFDIGGNSINLLKVHSKLEKVLGINIPIVKFFEYPSVRSLALYLRQESEGEDEKLQKEDKLKLKDSLSPGEARHAAEVAVIGMSAVVPGANDIHEFWENLKNGVESITFFTDDDLVKAGTTPQELEAPNYVKAKGIIEGAEYFDASFFGYTPREAEVMDPQVRIFHQCIWHALEDAGYNSFSYHRRIGLYGGATSNISWQVLSLLSGEGKFASGLQANLLQNRDFMCTHISYKFNLKGPSFTVNTACSTSLVAIHLAAQGLLNRECEMALAGGVTISYPQKTGYYYEEGMIQSPDGHCRAFDADSKGLVGGNGAGVVLLKRYEDALADGDHIYGIIKGSAINNDGFRKVGYSAPSVEGQAEVIRAAQAAAGVDPESITYIETHGTGTEFGDPVEVEALKIAFNTDKKRFCGIGSVKTNVGHLDCASGVAGFIKAVLALKHRLIPPSLHFKTPNPKLGLENSPFYVVSTLTEWNEQGDGSPRRAGVSSLGIGGTNAHVVLEEWREERIQRTKGREQETEGRHHRLILLSAKTPTALDKITTNLVNHFKENPGINLADAIYTLQVGRRASPYRKMMVCNSVEDAVEAFSSKSKRKSVRTFLAKEDNRSVIFVFSGQGSQYVNMGLELYKTESVFRDEMDRCFEILKASMDYDIKEILYPPVTRSELSQLATSTERINQTVIIQLLLFVFEYALAKLLMQWGIKPTAMIGYSLGEYVAACISGVFSLEDALKLVADRGQLIQETPQGAMLSVPLREKDIKPLLNQHKEISLAIVNGPSCVAAGSIEAVDIFEKEMQKKRLFCTRINIAHAVHSQLMNPIRNKFETKVKEVTLNKPRIPFISNVSGDWITLEEARNPRYWGDQLCATVRFSEGINQLMKEENAVFVEIGPGRVLSNIIRQHPNKKPGHLFVNLARHQQENESDNYFLLRAIGQLWLYGIEIDWPAFYSREKRYRIPLPTYPFEGKRYWIDDTIFRKIVELQAPDSSSTKKVVEEERDTSALVDPQQSPSTPLVVGEGGYEYEEEYEAPRDELEQNIARVWQEFLGFEKIGVYDNFFHLNGDSLTATQLITRLKEIYPVDIAMQDFFEEPTIDHLAQVVKTLLIEKIKNLSPEEKKSFLSGG
jgi:acyl transferase domain-containing protein/acyl carrier protein